MKKTLALVLALAMVFSTITVAFAEDAATIGADAQICADLGMLKGATGTVDAAYLTTAPSRIQAAVMFLRLKGLEAEATAFTGTENFADADKAAWAKPIMAYLKAHPELGWAGDGTNFDPTSAVTAQQYYKVMLEALGYKQNTATVVGDFTWENVIAFAAEKGLSKVAAVANFTVNDVAIATVEALKANTKEGGKTLVASLVEAGKVDKAKAVAAGLIVEAPAAPAVAVDEAKAIGNTAVEVTYEDDVDAAAAAEVSNYAIEGLEIKSAAVSASDTVVLETAAMTVGKIYTLTVGDKSVKFAGIAKVSGGPEIDTVVSEDVEEVVITFTKNVDLATASDVANYTISGDVSVENAEVDENEVTLTTVGLKNKTKYTVKVTNLKSVDGTVKKSDSDTFTSKYDLAAPKILTAVPETNQRLVVTFNEDVDQAIAEDIANYSIKVDETDGAELAITAASWDDDVVELTTEPMVKNEDYVLTVNNIADQRKVANVMTRPATKDFEGVAEDEDGPTWQTLTVLSPTTIYVELKDGSDIDEASATDLNNYTLEGLNIESIETIENDYQIFRGILTVEEMETGESYDLTIVDVLDEFGNAMDEKTKVVKATADSFASVKVNSAVATGENTVLVQFSGEVDEASAEDIANYSIDEEIGAPTKAVFEKTGAPANSVTLTVDDLINGYGEYDLTVNGVKDLAGNVLNYKKVVDTDDNVWDEDAPVLEDIEIVNNTVVALSFDEKVQFEDTPAQLVLAVNGDDNNTITLDAAETAENDTVVEFTYADTLDEGVDFTVYKVVYGGEDGGIKDLIGNPLLVSDIEFGDFVAEGTDKDATAAELDSYEQTNAKTFEVTMTENVALDAGEEVQNGFTVAVDTDDNKLVTFTKNAGIIEENTDYKFDFSTFLKDLHGLAVADSEDSGADAGKTIITGDFTDKDNPYVDTVVAKNRLTIRVTFNEDIDDNTLSVNDFELWNNDLDDEITITDLEEDTDGDNVVDLVVTTPLEARYEYKLIMAADKVDDTAGLGNDEDTFYFEGTNLAK